MPHPGLLYPEPRPLQQSTADTYPLRRRPDTVLSRSLWGLWVLVCIRYVEPSEHLWWVWALIPNAISHLLPSCWGFSFALGCGISPQSRPSTTQPPLQRPPSCWGFSALGRGVSPQSCTNAMQPLLQHHFFILGDWNAIVGSQEIPGVTGKFGLGVQNEVGQRLTAWPRERTGHCK